MSACSAGCGYCGRCDDGPRYNASCPECGQEFVIEYDSTGSLCDACCDDRDARAALELRMAKAALPVVPAKEVA